MSIFLFTKETLDYAWINDNFGPGVFAKCANICQFPKD